MENQFVNPKELEEKTTEQITEQYNFDEIKDAFDQAAVPVQLEFFFMVETMKIFLELVTFYLPIKATMNLFNFYVQIEIRIS